MAKLKMYSPFDSKLGVWMNPMFFMHAGQAERMWSELCNDGSTLPGKHPSDFTLFQVGEFDEETGRVSPVHPPVQLCTGLSVKKQPDAQLPFDSKK